MTIGKARLALATVLVAALAAGITVAAGTWRTAFDKLHLTAYFDNSNGIFRGDEVRILGVPVGQIDSIEPEPTRAKITFWIAKKYKVPASAEAVIMSPNLVSARIIQLTPAYTGGPRLINGAVIPETRTAVPVEWDDLREQLRKLTAALQPTQPGGVSPAGALVNTAAANLAGEGAHIREGIIQLAQTISALGDHSDDVFSTIKNLSTLVSGLRASTDVLQHLNGDLASVSALLSNDDGAIARAVSNVNTTITDVKTFVAENRDTLGDNVDKLTALSNTLTESLDDIKQTLHVVPPATDNFDNIYSPAQAALVGTAALNNMANPIQFLCSAIEAASRLGAQQSAKLCVQYLAPIVKNREYNFPPLGANPFIGARARPNELTYSEDRLRPDYRPAGPPSAPPPANAGPNNAPPQDNSTPLPVAAGAPTNPADGLKGIMLPPGAHP